MVSQTIAWSLLAEGVGPNFFESQLPLIIILGALFYFVLIHPERKRRRQHDQMLKSLKKNDRVLTVSGIYGTVVNVNNNNAGDITIKVDESSNAKLRITRSSIGQILTEGEPSEKTNET